MTLTRTGPKRRHNGGSKEFWWGFKQFQDELPTGFSELETTVSPGPPYVQKNNFYTRRETTTPGRFTGLVTGTGTVYKNWRVDGVLTSEHQYIGVDGTFVNEWVNQALAAINPSKPIVSLPNILWELRELPRMTRDLGRVLNGDIKESVFQEGYLAYTFGWAPLIRDAEALFGLGVEIERALERINQGRDNLKLSGTIDDRTDLLKRQEPLAGDIGVLWREYEVSKRIWYTAHWTADAVPEMPFDTGFQKFRWAIGLDRPYSIIWNAIPWSFLIDYFMDVSTFLEAAQGLQTYRPEAICLMAHYRTQLVVDDVYMAHMTEGIYQPGKYSAESKQRWIRSHPNPTIPGFRPSRLLDKMGILGALTAAKLGRRSGQLYNSTRAVNLAT